MNIRECVIWTSFFSSGQDKHQFTRPNGQVEEKNFKLYIEPSDTFLKYLATLADANPKW